MEGGAPLLTMWLSKPKAATKRCAMRDDTCKTTNRASNQERPGSGELGLSLEELVRRRARDILPHAIKACWLRGTGVSTRTDGH